MKGRRSDLVEVLENDRRLEEDRLPHLEGGNLPQRRDTQEPVGLVLQVDVDDVVLDPFFIQQDDRPLDVGSELEADQFEFFCHGQPPLNF
jgi:hypothetical protein